MLVRHFKKEVHFMLGSTGRPLSLFCHLLASTAKCSFPRTGTASPGMWSSGAQGDGKILTAEVRNDVLTHRAVQGSLHPAELTSDRAYALQRQHWQDLVAHMKHYKTYIFVGPVQTLADSLQAYNHGCVVFFVLVLQGVRAYSLGLYRLWRGACLFPFFKLPLQAEGSHLFSKSFQ